MTKTLPLHPDGGGRYIPCPRPAAHAHPKAHPQPVPPLVPVLCAVCDARGDDVPRHRAGNGAAHRRRCGARGRDPYRLARRRTDHRGGLVLRRGVRRGASARTSLSFPAKAVAFTGVRYDHSTMLYREKAAGRRLFLCRNADRPAGFSAEGIIRLHLFSPTPLASGSFA